MDKLERSHYLNYDADVGAADISTHPYREVKSSKNLIICDLHIHTSYSDGFFTPGEVVKKAFEKGLSTISITDHDSVNGVEEAIKAGLKYNITIIPGIELSAMYGEREIHILGYFIDYTNTELKDFLAFFRSQRLLRAREMVHRLNKLEIPVEIDTVIDNADGRSIGRPHIADAVLKTGSVKSYLEVFRKYIGFGRPAYVEKYRLDFKDAVNMIAKAGGLSFIAHPADFIKDTMLLELIKAGIDGVETVHPSLNRQRSQYYRGIAEEYYLLESGGSDFHGGNRNDENNLGLYGIPNEYIQTMQSRLVA